MVDDKIISINRGELLTMASSEDLVKTISKQQPRQHRPKHFLYFRVRHHPGTAFRFSNCRDIFLLFFSALDAARGISRDNLSVKTDSRFYIKYARSFIFISGFLNTNSDSNQKSPSNYGLMDQIAALHWLQENVAYFGGDPTNVTLVGHGTGASCVNFLMSSTAVPEGKS